jgi:hypothetical protein
MEHADKIHPREAMQRTLPEFVSEMLHQFSRGLTVVKAERNEWKDFWGYRSQWYRTRLDSGTWTNRERAEFHAKWIKVGDELIEKYCW